MKLIFSPPPQVMVPYLGFVMGPGYAGPKQKRKEAYLEAVSEITAEIRKIAPNYVKMLTEPFDDIRPFRWQNYDVDIYEYVIDLTRPTEEIRPAFERPARSRYGTAKVWAWP
jgi:hypothetical protein